MNKLFDFFDSILGLLIQLFILPALFLPQVSRTDSAAIFRAALCSWFIIAVSVCVLLWI